LNSLTIAILIVCSFLSKCITVYCKLLAHKMTTVIWTLVDLLEMDDGSQQFVHRQSPGLVDVSLYVSQLAL